MSTLPLSVYMIPAHKPSKSRVPLSANGLLLNPWPIWAFLFGNFPHVSIVTACGLRGFFFVILVEDKLTWGVRVEASHAVWNVTQQKQLRLCLSVAWCNFLFEKHFNAIKGNFSYLQAEREHASLAHTQRWFSHSWEYGILCNYELELRKRALFNS